MHLEMYRLIKIAVFFEFITSHFFLLRFSFFAFRQITHCFSLLYFPLLSSNGSLPCFSSLRSERALSICPSFVLLLSCSIPAIYYLFSIHAPLSSYSSSSPRRERHFSLALLLILFTPFKILRKCSIPHQYSSAMRNLSLQLYQSSE